MEYLLINIDLNNFYKKILSVPNIKFHLRFKNFTFIIEGTGTACFDPVSDLLNDKHLEDNNCESFGKTFHNLPPSMSGYLEREIYVSNAINFRSDWDTRCFEKNIFQYFPENMFV